MTTDDDNNGDDNNAPNHNRGDNEQGTNDRQLQCSRNDILGTMLTTKARKHERTNERTTNEQ